MRPDRRLDRRTLLAWGAAGIMGPAMGASSPRVLYQGELLADYFQIYLRDEGHPDLPDDYTDEALSRRMTASRHAVVIHTARNMTVPVRVIGHDQRPAPELASWQQVVEAGITCPSGQLVLAGLTDYAPSAARLAVPAGALGIRVGMSGLDTLSEDGLEGEDRYVIQVWPGAEPQGVRVLKAWSP